MARISPYVFFQEFDNNGDPLAGGLLYTYEAGTSTPKETYTDASEATANANPVVLDASGRADVWLGTGAYKFVLRTSAGVLIKEVDNIVGEASNVFGATVIEISTNTTITETYENSVINCTSAVTLSLISASTAEQGFLFTVKNSSAGQVIIDPDATDLINGDSSFILQKGQTVIVECTGTGWLTLFSIPDDLRASTTAGISLKASNGDTFLSGGAGGSANVTLGGNMSGASTHKLVNMIDPSSAQDYATKAYVDARSRNFLDGFKLSPAGSSATMPIGAGSCADSTNAAYITLASDVNKTTSAWAVGDTNGGLDTGTIANNTWYHFYAIRRPDTGVVDVVFSTNATSPALPTNYTQFRHIGFGKTDGSAQWVKIEQDGDNFYYPDPVASVNGVQTATTRQTPVIDVPLGLPVLAHIRATTSGGVSASFYTKVCEVAETDAAASASNHSLALTAAVASAVTSVSQYMSLRVNTSGQIAYRSSNTDASSLIYIFVNGFTYRRGKE